MALTAKQRNSLPRSPFRGRVNRRFPVATGAQAVRDGIGEVRRIGTISNALAGAAQPEDTGR